MKAPQAPLRASGKRPDLWSCRNRFPLICTAHPTERIEVPCGRRTCKGCQLRKQFEVRTRLLEGIRQVPPGRFAMFFTLTFPRQLAPSEDEAHRALRSLVRRLRYRGYLGAFAWVLQRQKAKPVPSSSSGAAVHPPGTLHYHGIMHLPWFSDGLKEWRELIQASGFGVQNRLVLARAEHAPYCARYISHRHARVAPLRRTYAFSRDFPLSAYEAKRRRIAETGAAIGLVPECDWVPAFELFR